MGSPGKLEKYVGGGKKWKILVNWALYPCNELYNKIKKILTNWMHLREKGGLSYFIDLCPFGEKINYFLAGERKSWVPLTNSTFPKNLRPYLMNKHIHKYCYFCIEYMYLNCFITET